MVSLFDPLIFLGAFGIVLAYYLGQKVARYNYLKGYNKKSVPLIKSAKRQALDMKTLSGLSYYDIAVSKFKAMYQQIGKYALIKILVFYVVLAVAAIGFNNTFIRTSPLVVILATCILGSLLGYQWLLSQKRKDFEESFPVALNMLTSAVSAGESLTQSIAYVGDTLSGNVANEFRSMGKRLQLGESPEEVFRKSCVRFPYPTFYFFIITMRANMERGGQLKDIIQRLNRLMFDIRAIEKKKSALTSEVRTSAKIVAAIPFIFLFAMRFLSPENFEYVMTDSNGRLILYYMLISEFIGIMIVWGLMRSVR